MGTDLGKLMKLERLTEDRVQFLVYQMLRGLKVTTASYDCASSSPQTKQNLLEGFK